MDREFHYGIIIQSINLLLSKMMIIVIFLVLFISSSSASLEARIDSIEEPKWWQASKKVRPDNYKEDWIKFCSKGFCECNDNQFSRRVWCDHLFEDEDPSSWELILPGNVLEL